jgi:hypothetical protein
MLESYNIDNKKVSFHNIIRVMIIQPKKDNNIKNILWWNDDDFILAYNNSIMELKVLMQRHIPMNLFQAKKILYQPLCYDPSNFD